MHHTRTGLIIAFHGCDKSIADNLVSTNGDLKHSSNDYDWLGHGAYFWENSYSRALDFAKELKKNPKSSIKKPAVLGAVLDLGNCLNLLDFENLKLVKEAHSNLEQLAFDSQVDLPKNKKGTDLLLRFLDCAVLESLHKTVEHPYDSVRGLFSEGKELYENAGFRSKDHIQICVRNPNCIKGFFHPRKAKKGYPHI